MAKKTIKIEISESEINRRIDQIEKLDCDEDLRSFLIDTLKALVELDRLIGLKSATIARLRKVFGKQSEKSHAKAPEDKKEAKGNTGGNGHHGKDDYPDAEEVSYSLDGLKPKDICSECKKGKLYSWDPGIYVRITGSAPLVATIHKTEKLRCNLCGKIFEASYEGKGAEKFDSSAKAIIALLHYKSSMPFYRLEKLQLNLNIPMPRSTLWNQVESLADHLIIVWKYMVGLAANGELMYIDDTTARLLSLIRENELNKENKKQRTGMYTTGILSKYQEHQLILYFTGRAYSGENLARLLEKRTSKVPVAIMSDALPGNKPKDFEILQYLCLTHGRRNFIDVEESFKEQADYVVKLIAEVYKNDGITKSKEMTPLERLEFHKLNSAPVMDQLKKWLNDAFKDKLVEPNSTLGKGITYMLKHWKGLTGFLRHVGAPLDNNVLEAQLRVPVLNRKNWLFFKNTYGAFVGDIILSMIKTCEVEGENPLEYMITIQDQHHRVKENPSLWMPWNYKLNLS